MLLQEVWNSMKIGNTDFWQGQLFVYLQLIVSKTQIIHLKTSNYDSNQKEKVFWIEIYNLRQGQLLVYFPRLTLNPEFI